MSDNQQNVTLALEIAGGTQTASDLKSFQGNINNTTGSIDGLTKASNNLSQAQDKAGASVEKSQGIIKTAFHGTIDVINKANNALGSIIQKYNDADQGLDKLSSRVNTFIKIGGHFNPMLREAGKVTGEVAEQWRLFTLPLQIVVNKLEHVQRVIGEVTGLFKDKTEAVKGTNDALTSTIADYSELDVNIDKTDNTMKGSIGTAVKLAVALGGVFANSKALEASADFEAKMRNVNSILLVSEDEFYKTNQEVLGLANSLKLTSASELADTLYQINSSGIYGADAMNVLSITSKSAAAGLTTASTAATGLTAVLNAMGLQSQETGRIAGIMFKSVQLGVLTFDDFANGVGNVISTANQLKIPFEQIGAAISLSTRKGTKPGVAFNELNTLLLSMIAPSTTAAAKAEKLGLDMSETAIKTKGLNTVLADMMRVTKGSTSELFALLGRTEALDMALKLAGGGAGEFNKEIAGYGDVSKTLDDALEQNTNNYNANAKALGIVWDNLKITFGDAVKDFVNPFVKALVWVVEHFNNMDASTKTLIARIVVWGGAILGIINVFKTLIWTIGIGRIATTAWNLATQALTTSLGLTTVSLSTMLSVMAPFALAAGMFYGIDQAVQGLDKSSGTWTQTLINQVNVLEKLRTLQDTWKTEAENAAAEKQHLADIVAARQSASKLREKEKLDSKDLIQLQKDLITMASGAHDQAKAGLLKEATGLTPRIKAQEKIEKSLIKVEPDPAAAEKFADLSKTITADFDKATMDHFDLTEKNLKAAAKKNIDDILALGKKGGIAQIEIDKQVNAVKVTLFNELAENNKKKQEEITKNTEAAAKKAEEIQKKAQEVIEKGYETRLKAADTVISGIEANENLSMENQVKEVNKALAAKKTIYLEESTVKGVSEDKKTDAVTKANEIQRKINKNNSDYEKYLINEAITKDKEKLESNLKNLEIKKQQGKIQTYEALNEELYYFNTYKSELETQLKKTKAGSEQRKSIEKDLADTKLKIITTTFEKEKAFIDKITAAYKARKVVIDMINDVQLNFLNDETDQNEKDFKLKKINEQTYFDNRQVLLETAAHKYKDMADNELSDTVKRNEYITASNNLRFQKEIEEIERKDRLEKSTGEATFNMYKDITGAAVNLGGKLQESNNGIISTIGTVIGSVGKAAGQVLDLQKGFQDTADQVSKGEITEEAGKIKDAMSVLPIVMEQVETSLDNLNKFEAKSENNFRNLGKAVKNFGADSIEAKEAIKDANEQIADSFNALPGILGGILSKVTRLFTDLIGVTRSESQKAADSEAAEMRKNDQQVVLDSYAFLAAQDGASVEMKKANALEILKDKQEKLKGENLSEVAKAMKSIQLAAEYAAAVQKIDDQRAENDRQADLEYYQNLSTQEGASVDLKIQYAGKVLDDKLDKLKKEDIGEAAKLQKSLTYLNEYTAAVKKANQDQIDDELKKRKELNDLEVDDIVKLKENYAIQKEMIENSTDTEAMKYKKLNNLQAGYLKDSQDLFEKSIKDRESLIDEATKKAIDGATKELDAQKTIFDRQANLLKDNIRKLEYQIDKIKEKYDGMRETAAPDAAKEFDALTAGITADPAQFNKLIYQAVSKFEADQTLKKSTLDNQELRGEITHAQKLEQLKKMSAEANVFYSNIAKQLPADSEEFYTYQQKALDTFKDFRGYFDDYIDEKEKADTKPFETKINQTKADLSDLEDQIGDIDYKINEIKDHFDQIGLDWKNSMLTAMFGSDGWITQFRSFIDTELSQKITDATNKISEVKNGLPVSGSLPGQTSTNSPTVTAPAGAISTQPAPTWTQYPQPEVTAPAMSSQGTSYFNGISGVQYQNVSDGTSLYNALSGVSYENAPTIDRNLVLQKIYEYKGDYEKARQIQSDADLMAFAKKSVPYSALPAEFWNPIPTTWNATGRIVGKNGPELVGVGEVGPEPILANGRLETAFDYFNNMKYLPAGGSGGGRPGMEVNVYVDTVYTDDTRDVKKMVKAVKAGIVEEDRLKDRRNG